jgi:hypothetical protein
MGAEVERFRNAHSSDIDGVAPGAVGEFNRAVVQGLVDAGHLVPVDGAAVVRPAPRDGESVEDVTARFDRAWNEREARFERELAERDERIVALEAEVARLTAEVETLTDPSKAKA